MKLKNALVVTATGLFVASCGGGDGSTQGTALLGQTTSVSAPPAAAVVSTTVNAKGETVVLSTNNPPDMTGPAFSTDMKRMRAERLEKWKTGQPLEAAAIPEDKRAQRPNKLLAAVTSFLGISSDPAPTRTAAAVVSRALGETVKVAPDLDAIPADASTRGAWSKVYDWPLIPIHMSMMPDGRLLSFGTTAGGRQGAAGIYSIYDPSLGPFDGHMTLPNGTGTDIFCSVALALPGTDQIMAVGGDVQDGNGFPLNKGNNNTTLFGLDNSMVRGNNMNLPRWYASTVTMTNGETYVQGGLGGEAYPEIRSTAGVWRKVATADTSRLDYWYPHNWLAQDGRVFGYDSYGNYYYVNTATGALNIVNQWDVNRFGETGTAVMYRPGQILQIAGYSAAVSLIDIRGATPTMTPLANLAKRRQDADASVLPDGKVLLTGGGEVFNEQTNTNRTASIWNPDTRTWVQGASGTMDRLYHSVNMLMTDGTVLVGGGGAWGPLNNTNVEYYYPPYLFNANGTMAARPTISSAPATASVGGSIDLTVSTDVTRVTMIKAGSVTHSLNNEQNFNELTFTRSGDTLHVNMPTKAVDAAPGYYMVFALNAQGTPSLARIVKVGAPVVAPAPPTNLAAVGSATGVTLTWSQAGSVTSNIISRAAAAAGPFTVLATVTPRTTYTDPITTPGTYYYTVKAVTASGTSLASNTAAGTVPAAGGGTGTPPPTVPPQGAVSAPTGLTGYPCGADCWTTDTGNHVAWKASATTTVTGYAIRRSTTGAGGPWTVIAAIGKKLTYTDKSVTAGKTYHYSVAAMTPTASSPYTSLSYGITSNITLDTPPPPPPPPPPTGGTNYAITLNSQGETKFIVMNWWRGDPATEGDFRQPGICTGPAPTGNCYLGARKTFRPQGFYIQNSMLWLEVPQYEGTVNSFDHYALPIELVKNGCTFMVQHVRTHSRFEFPLNPPGLEILPHTWTMSADLCAGYDPTSAAWVANLNAAVDAMLGPDPFPYTPPAYPYNDPRTGKDPSQP